MILLLLIFNIPVSASCIGSVNGNSIYINNCSNIIDLNNSINNENLLKNIGEGEWLLNANLINNNTNNIFYINESTVRWLKINSTKMGVITTYWYYRTDGKTEINNTKITSWNTTSNKPESPNVRTNPRSYIYANGALSKMNITNSNISNLGYQYYDVGFGVTYYTSSGNVIYNNTILQTHRGIAVVRSSNNNTISNNIISTSPFTESFGLFIWAYSQFNTISYNNITTPDIPNTGTDSCYGLYLWSANNNSVINNTIRTNGQLSNGIDINSESNYIENNTITNTYGVGIMVESLGKNNVLRDNIVTSLGNSWGAQIKSGINNSFYGGTIRSENSYDYYLLSAGITNNFTSTNFTVRKIYFKDTTSRFNYNYDGNITWLKTTVSASSQIKREDITWSQNNLKWNDTSSINNITSTYTIEGLYPNTNYSVFRTSGGIQTNTYNLTSDSNGNLIPFNITLTGKTEVLVQQGGT